MSKAHGNDGFSPVPHDHKEFLARCAKRRGFMKEMNKADPEIEALDLMLEARKRAGLTQDEVAKLMKVSRPLVARLERGLHAPNIDTLMRYADACGCRLRLTLEPKKTHQRV